MISRTRGRCRLSVYDFNATMRVGERVFFNAASIGIVPTNSQAEADRRSSPEAGVAWSDAVEEVRRGVGALLGVQSTYLTLYHNTTAGVQRIFTRLGHLVGRGTPTLLTTDLEYPGIMALADENWQGRLVVVEVADLIWQRKAHLVEAVLRKAVLLTRPTVVYISHISRASGYQLRSSFLTFLRRTLPRIVIIVDGAQAVGNCTVSQDFLELSDFYVTSGHKWLCGLPTLGIVHAHDSWKIDDPAQGYSLASGSRGTGSLGSLLSLARSVEDLNGGSTGEAPASRGQAIAEHNVALAKEFVKLLKAARIRSVPSEQTEPKEWKWNGIVVLPSPSRDLRSELSLKADFCTILDEAWRQRLLGGSARGCRFFLRLGLDKETKEIARWKNGSGGPERLEVGFRRVKLDEQTSPFPPGGAIRFCFHYYHCLRDVRRLADSIIRLKRRLRA